MKTCIVWVITIVVLLVVIISFLLFIDTVDSERMSINDCIEQVARSEGYTGNVHSKEAYVRFSSLCGE